MLLIDKETGSVTFDYEGARKILTDQIKPCPFCGSSWVFLLHSPVLNENGNTNAEIFCCGCKFKSAKMDSVKLKTIWNSRNGNDEVSCKENGS